MTPKPQATLKEKLFFYVPFINSYVASAKAGYTLWYKKLKCVHCSQSEILVKGLFSR